MTPRQTDILELIRDTGSVEVEDLSARFSVTTQTIRRDLSDLCDRGLAARTHGGARRAPSVSNRDHETRRALNASAKTSIARQVAELIPHGCSVMINIGTTTEAVARALAHHENLVVISNNINVINSFLGTPAKELILAGGTVRQSDGAIVGEEAVEFVSRYKADFAILGASAIDADGAVLDFDAREVSVARALLANSRRAILCADHTKFTHTAPIRICEIGDVDYFVTDKVPQFSNEADLPKIVVAKDD